jgi:hypothetical protein
MEKIGRKESQVSSFFCGETEEKHGLFSQDSWIARKILDLDIPE